MGKHKMSSCLVCNKEMRSDNLPRHIKLYHGEAGSASPVKSKEFK